jgi:putative ABC transport system permease protein
MSYLFQPFIWKTAWRDSRKERRKLFLFASAIIMGVAALVSVNSFGENLRREVNTQAKSLLAADLVINSRKPIAESYTRLADSLGIEAAFETSLNSMVYFPGSGNTRLSQIRAIEGNYPFYGTFETIPEGAIEHLQNAGVALVDQSMMLQFGAEVGDSLRIGSSSFVIKAAITGIPGESAAASLVGPRVYISLQDLPETGLIQMGSLVNYKQFWKFPPSLNEAEVRESVSLLNQNDPVSIDTTEERRQGVNTVVNNVTRFLNMIGFLALLLGAVGIASSIHVYTQRKLDTVAVLRCLGLTSKQAMAIFLLQTLFFGFLGTVIGSLIGTSIQYVFPVLLGDFLPLDISYQFSFKAVIEGLITGFIVTFIFSLLPLLGIRKVSPLSVLRSEQGSQASRRDPLSLLVMGLGLVVLVLFAILQAKDWFQGVVISGIILAILSVLSLMSWLIVRLAKRVNTEQWNYVWRQGLANLHRPKNQTWILVLALGLGTTLIMTQASIQHNLLGQINEVDTNGQPNLILFDVQTDQKDAVASLIEQKQLPVLFEVPVVTMRLSKIKGIPVDTLLRDSTSTIPRWALSREYRSTYRADLVDTEQLLRGELQPSWEPSQGLIPISLEVDIAQDLQVDLGDTLTIDVQGIPMETVVGSIRQVDWQRVQPNFFIVFPEGPLNRAPQFWVLVSRTETKQQSAEIQRAVVQSFPNISAVDLELILSTIATILDKASFVIRFMALFSILTGLIVLAGSVMISRYQRIKENVLLRTIGASRRQILGILLAEYTLLASLSTLTGLILSIGSSWAITYFIFEGPFSIPVLTYSVGWFSLMALTISIAWLNSRSTLNRPPLEVLRNEQ